MMKGAKMTMNAILKTQHSIVTKTLDIAYIGFVKIIQIVDMKKCKILDHFKFILGALIAITMHGKSIYLTNTFFSHSPQK